MAIRWMSGSGGSGRALGCVAVLAALCAAAHAQTGAVPAKPVAKPQAAAAGSAGAKPAAKPVAKAAAVKTVAKAPVKPPAARVAPAKVAPAEAVAHLPLSTAQQAIAANVHIGRIPCELGQTVELVPMDGMAGFFKLHLGKATYTVAPEETTTGAIRLEDRPNGIVWLQLANKSMLMNQKIGRRMADECMSPPQLLVAQEMQRNPPPGLLDAPRPAPAGGASAAPMLQGQTVAKP